MGTDDIFKKRREARKKRQHEMKTPKANSYLIVTEGKRTEPLYLRGLQKLIMEKVGGAIDVVERPTIDVHGAGCSTGSLLQVTEQLVREAKILYQNIWVVFDKDDFQDFDIAIADAVNKGYRVAWSNQAFEYWLYLHFHYSDAALHRHEWNKKLEEIFAEYGLGNGKYEKNYEDIYALVDTYGGVSTAIKNAKRRMASFDVKRDKPSGYDPGTTVHELVEDLKKYVDSDN